ncbi:LacI family DNA-binding transcriptional regulator [Trinickia dinghuensis]|uniref:LacI family DNA-binding transcriptional regulator n=2 Tax=Trinickia dinghuensis TaxID=2291023 RepID=A0A3D8JZU7_9BURK|nr:LacI family DNA-binding transcriptional regulator [Trinickia dinghuensis]RDU98135.1 LacI family DNA-binding transcriptional regulator [Trinickia dinghuensis]
MHSNGAEKHAEKPNSGGGRRRPSGRVTLEDVARHAQVSTMTVSRALRDPSLVSPSVRERVQAAVAQLGYIPNRAASTLASARSKLIVVLVPSLSNAVFVETLAGVQDCVGPSGYQLLIGNTGYSPERQAELLQAYLSHAPDGFLVAGIDDSNAVRRHLAASGVPLVHMFDLTSTDEWSVGFSQRRAGYAIGKHLIARGARRPGFIAAQLDPRTMQRRAGYRRALREAGRDPGVEVLTKEPSSPALGGALLKDLLSRTPKCDAVFCCNDDLALGALFECQRLGIAVPRELAIVGFNDLPFAAVASPTITTVATPRYAVGFEAARMLLRIVDGEVPEQRRIDLGFELVVREST